MSKAEKKPTQKAVVKFTKQQFLKAANFTRVDRDVLAVLLEDNKQYTLEEVHKKLNEFKARKVK